MARLPTDKTVTTKNAIGSKLGPYAVVATPEAQEFVRQHGGESLERLKRETVSEPREVVLRKVAVKGWTKVLVAFLNPYVKTAYIAFLDKERLEIDDITKENAFRTVSLGIGARPDLPPGEEYVNNIWRDLIASG